MNEKELNERIVDDLQIIPDELREAEIILGKARQALDERKTILADAEFDAEINAVIDGKNAEERKRQARQAIAESDAVRLAQNELYAAESELIELEANVKAISRRFNASLALAELQAARLNLMARYNKSN
jgi:hypothetical protein